MVKIPAPFRAPRARTIFRTGVIAGTIVVLLVGYTALIRDQIGQFTSDPVYLLQYLLSCFVLVFGPLLFAAIIAELVSDRSRRIRRASQPWFILTRIVAWIGVLAGGVMAFLAGDAALWHNPQLSISDDPAHLMLIVFSWFVVVGGPVFLFAAIIEVIYRVRRKHR